MEKVLPDKSKMKSSNGNYITQGLFYEWDVSEGKPFAIFTNQDEDINRFGKKYLSFKRLYLELEDTTEEEFSEKYLLGWKHWERLESNTIVRRLINQCRDSLERRLRIKGMRSIIKAAEKGNYGAARFLAMGDWKPKQSANSKKAREKEDAIRREMYDEAEKSDVARLLLVK